MDVRLVHRSEKFDVHDDEVDQNITVRDGPGLQDERTGPLIAHG